MFFEFKDGIFNKTLLTRVFAYTNYDENKGEIEYYKIFLYQVGEEYNPEWFYKSDEKETFEQDFNYLRNILLGKKEGSTSAVEVWCSGGGSTGI